MAAFDFHAAMVETLAAASPDNSGLFNSFARMRSGPLTTYETVNGTTACAYCAYCDGLVVGQGQCPGCGARERKNPAPRP